MTVSPTRRRVLAVGIVVGSIACSAAAQEGEKFLVTCEGPEVSDRVREAAAELARHLGEAYPESHPSAAWLAESVAGISARLVEGLDRVGPRQEAFLSAWDEVEPLGAETPFRDDPVLGPALPGYGRAVADLDALLGCAIPCSAIPIAHFLAELAHGMDAYTERNFGVSTPEALPRVEELAVRSRELHETLHDLEVAVPGIVASVEGLEHSLRGSSLVDTDEPEDIDVKRRLSALRVALDALIPALGSCVPPEGQTGHEGHAH